MIANNRTPVVILYTIALASIAIDQLTKAWVRANLPIGEPVELVPGFSDWLQLLHIENTGAAFGMFQSGGLIFTIIALIVAAVIVYYSFRLQPQQRILAAILGLQLGGAVGNLIDRLLRGPVTDFFSFFSIWNAPIFNVADASITIGVGLLLLLMWLEGRHAQSAPVADNQ
jgi:signal peptidase II